MENTDKHRVVCNVVRQTHVVVITMRAILVALFVGCHILAERLLTFFAHKCHFRRPGKPVSLRLSMALGAVKPLLAAWCADGDLCVQDVFALYRT
jgi:hypothetical protein